ncbi:hypothetical protein PFISCL1PPCAC_22471, partial [Pristionchus fissidentatus]
CYSMPLDECPVCMNQGPFILRDGRFSCRVCNYEDQRRAEYEEDADCNFIDFTKSNTRMFSELQRSVRKSRLRKGTGGVGGAKKQRSKKIPHEERLPAIPIGLTGKRFRSRVQPQERDPPGDILPRRHPEVEQWKRVAHRLSAFTQLIARTTRFLVKEKRAREEIKPVAMVIFRRLLASQNIAFSDREWTDIEEDRYTVEMRRLRDKNVVISTVAEQREQIASQIATQNEGLRTGEGVGEDGMWSMLMSDTVTENLQVAAPARADTGRLVQKRKRVWEVEVVKRQTETSIDALVRGGVLTLNVELLVAISFLACAVTGARVGMTDLIRWYREARIALPPHFLHDLVKIKYFDDGRQAQLESCSYEPHFNFYLHECHSFLQRVMSATRIPRRRISIRLDEIVARHMHHLNLPFSLMERALVILALARVDTVNLSIDQADEEGRYCNEDTCKYGMADGRVHPMLSTAYRAPFVSFSADTRAVAVVLLVLRMTFGLRDDRAFTVKNSPRFFNMGAWLRQLRMRMRVYGGEKGNTVVGESMRESPRDYDVEWNVQLNRVNLSVSYGKLTYRQTPRANFPDNWEPLPKLDGERFLCKDGLPFPDDGEAIRASASRVAMMTPLIYHGERVREEMEERSAEKRTIEEREAVKLMGRSFKELDIEECSEPLQPASVTVRRERREEGEVVDEWKHLFPAAVNFEISQLPRLSVTSLVRLINREPGRYILGGGSGDVVFSFVHAAPNLSRPHRFLIQTLSRLIVEAPAVIYAASTMLERRMLRYQSCLSTVQQLESGAPVVVADCGVAADRKRELHDTPLTLRRVPGDSRNIIDIEHPIEEVHPKAKKSVQMEGTVVQEVIQIDDDGETQTGESRDQRSIEETEGESAESLVDEEIDDEEEEGEEEEEAERVGDTQLREDLNIDGDEDDVEILEEAQVERPCKRYKRATDVYRPVVQRRYYLNFDYLWTILAMRLW